MKKIFALLLAILMLASMICVAAVPASASGYTISLCALGKDGRIWAVNFHENFEDAWNEAVYYATHLEEAWNSAERYESEEDRVGEDGFVNIIVDIYADWNADSNGSFGTGIGFKDGVIYVPKDAKLEVNLNGNTRSKALCADAGADFRICNGTVIGEIHADKSAKAAINNVYVAGNALKTIGGSNRYGSIFGEGSLTNILVIVSLMVSAVSICLTALCNKKKAISADTAENEDQEE